MDYQHALNAWAERRNGLEPGTVTNADLSATTAIGGGCDSCACDYVVYDLSYRVGDKTKYEDDIEMPFAELLKEILERTNG